jgi:hypothetical protein
VIYFSDFETIGGGGGSVNAFATSDGVDRSQYITGTTTPRLDFLLESNIGSVIMVRSLTEIPGKFHFEVRIDGFYSGADDAIYVGIMDSGAVTSVATTLASRPGEGSIAGCSCRVSEGGANMGVSANGASTLHALGVNAAVGDVFIVEGDPAANTVSFYYWDASAGALVNGGAPLTTKTLTSLIPTDWYAVAGGRRGNGVVATSDSGTANFGASAFLMTPTSGYAGW